MRSNYFAFVPCLAYTFQNSNPEQKGQEDCFQLSVSSAVAPDDSDYLGHHSVGLCCCSTSRQLSVLQEQSCVASNKLVEHAQKCAVVW